VFGHCADEEELAYVLREWNAEVDSVNDLRVEDELLVVLDTGDIRLFSVNLAFSSMSMKLMTSAPRSLRWLVPQEPATSVDTSLF
jgi:hypothetical protein